MRLTTWTRREKILLVGVGLLAALWVGRLSAEREPASAPVKGSAYGSGGASYQSWRGDQLRQDVANLQRQQEYAARQDAWPFSR